MLWQGVFCIVNLKEVRRMDASSSNGTGPDKQYKSEKSEEMPYEHSSHSKRTTK